MTKQNCWLVLEIMFSAYLIVSCCINPSDLQKNNFENGRKMGGGKNLLAGDAAHPLLHSNESAFDFSNIGYFFYEDKNYVRIHHYFFCRNYWYWF
ncbi:MAG: hypothetical protein ABI419_04330 [Ginsengibacter sp.]